MLTDLQIKKKICHLSLTVIYRHLVIWQAVLSKPQHLLSQGLGIPHLLQFKMNSDLTYTNIAHYLHLNCY